MTNVEKLTSWFENERAHMGLVDMKVVPGEGAPSILIEDMAGEILGVLETLGMENVGEDVTDQIL